MLSLSVQAESHPQQQRWRSTGPTAHGCPVRRASTPAKGGKTESYAGCKLGVSEKGRMKGGRGGGGGGGAGG